MLKTDEKPKRDRLDDLLAELLRHEQIKRERGRLDISDRALHFRVRKILRD